MVPVAGAPRGCNFKFTPPAAQVCSGSIFCRFQDRHTRLIEPEAIRGLVALRLPVRRRCGCLGTCRELIHSSMRPSLRLAAPTPFARSAVTASVHTRLIEPEAIRGLVALRLPVRRRCGCLGTCRELIHSSMRPSLHLAAPTPFARSAVTASVHTRLIEPEAIRGLVALRLPVRRRCGLLGTCRELIHSSMRPSSGLAAPTFFAARRVVTRVAAISSSTITAPDFRSAGVIARRMQYVSSPFVQPVLYERYLRSACVRTAL
jgi:hypothetical protein